MEWSHKPAEAADIESVQKCFTNNLGGQVYILQGSTGNCQLTNANDAMIREQLYLNFARKAEKNSKHKAHQGRVKRPTVIL